MLYVAKQNLAFGKTRRTHLPPVRELLDLSSENTRNNETCGHDAKTGQYFIPHSCSVYSVRHTRKETDTLGAWKIT